EASPGSDGSGRSVLGRRISPGGSPEGQEFQINITTAGDQTGPTVATGPAGAAGAVVVFTDAGGEAPRVLARRLEVGGGGAGAEFEVGPAAVGAAPSPAVTPRPGGGFLVVWRLGDGLEGRFLTATGAPDGPPFPIQDQGLAAAPREPAAAAVGDVGFAVVWTAFGAGSAGNDADDAVVGQLLGPEGRTLGGRFQVNATTSDTQYRPQIAAGAGADFVVAWTARGIAGDPDYAVVSRLLSAEGPLFADGFESGDTGAWTALVD
ncbi:MAG: hypothetical protein AAGM22_09930, partial [Acidobacteriota bacterium]